MKQLISKLSRDISYEYIRGLIEGEGCFTFSSIPQFIRNEDGSFYRVKVPAFILAMHERDRELLEMIRERLKIEKNINWLKASTSDGHQRGATVRLIIRDLGTLKNIIIPLLYGQLHGYKKLQFTNWLERIGSDPAVREDYKLLYRLHKNGFYYREIKTGKFFGRFIN